MALVIAITFRKELKVLILRIRKGPGGTEFDPEQAQAAAKGAELATSADFSASAGMEAIADVVPSQSDVTVHVAPAVASAEAPPPLIEAGPRIRPDLNPVVARLYEELEKKTAPGKPSEDRLQEALIRLAQLDLRYSFEKVYRIITGSQVDALLYLHARPWGASAEEVRKIFDTNPETANVLTWETWRGYLTSTTGLAIVDEARRWRITPVGEVFLQYLLEQRYTDRKAL